MSVKHFIHLFAALIFSMLSFSTMPGPAASLLSYSIEEPSRLFLKGTTNVNSFTCNCNSLESLPPLRFEMGFQKEKSSAVFKHARLQFRTDSLDCGNRQMNKDLYNALRYEEHPMISFVLLQANGLPIGAKASGPDGWMDISVRAQLTIGGVCRTVELPVRARQTGADTYRFVSRHTIDMKDFSIEPPTAMLGLVKVDSQVDIHFDLAVEVRELG